MTIPNNKKAFENALQPPTTTQRDRETIRAFHATFGGTLMKSSQVSAYTVDPEWNSIVVGYHSSVHQKPCAEVLSVHLKDGVATIAKDGFSKIDISKSEVSSQILDISGAETSQAAANLLADAMKVQSQGFSSILEAKSSKPSVVINEALRWT